MYCLFVDSAFDQALCALWHNSTVVAEVKAVSRQAQHCELWQQLLDDQSLSLKDIQAVACGVGPGSYTGIRSAIASAQAVAVARSLPLVSISSLLLFVPYEVGSYLVAVDGGVSGLYAQRVIISQDGSCLFVMAEEPFCTQPSLIHDSCVLTSERVLSGLCATPRQSSSQVAAKYAMQQIASANYAFEARPIYLRKTQAELARGE